MNQEERKKNIEVLFSGAKHLEETGGIDAAEKLYLEAAKQADQHLGFESKLRVRVLLGCIDFYEKQGREQDSDLMQERLRKVATVFLQENKDV